MDGLVFDIVDLFKEVYNYTPMVLPKAEKRTQIGSNIYGLSDHIGREVFLPIIITAGGVDYEFPFAIIGIEGEVNTIETGMTERQGAVIEEVSEKPFRISIKGFFIDANNQFPDDQIAKFKELWKKREPVHLKCALTDLFLSEDDRVVIQNFQLPEKSKSIGVRDFTMKLVQDGILDLYVVEG